MKRVISFVLVLALLLVAVAAVTACSTEEERKLKGLNKLTFEEYSAMQPAQRREHYEAYIELLGEEAGADAYFKWYNAALAEYNEEQNRETIDGDDIEADLGTEG